jgi:hypothetical protein
MAWSRGSAFSRTASRPRWRGWSTDYGTVKREEEGKEMPRFVTVATTAEFAPLADAPGVPDIPQSWGVPSVACGASAPGTPASQGGASDERGGGPCTNRSS